MAAKVNIKLVVLIRKKETPREKVVKNDAMIVRFFSPIKIKLSTLLESLSINLSLSCSIILFIIAAPEADNIKEIIVKKTNFISGIPLFANIIPVKPVRPTLNIIFGFERDINAFSFFIMVILFYFHQKRHLMQS